MVLVRGSPLQFSRHTRTISPIFTHTISPPKIFEAKKPSPTTKQLACNLQKLACAKLLPSPRCHHVCAAAARRRTPLATVQLARRARAVASHPHALDPAHTLRAAGARCRLARVCSGSLAGRRASPMSIECVRLEAVRSGQFGAPAENQTVKVTNGPWKTKGSHLFKRNVGESAEAWRTKVFRSVKAVRCFAALAPPLSILPAPASSRCAGSEARAVRAARGKVAASEAASPRRSTARQPQHRAGGGCAAGRAPAQAKGQTGRRFQS